MALCAVCDAGKSSKGDSKALGLLVFGISRFKDTAGSAWEYKNISTILATLQRAIQKKAGRPVEQILMLC